MAKNKELNELIKRIKYQYDLNQGEIASKIGVKDTYLSDVLNGRADFNDTLRAKIYEVFSCVQAELSSQRYAGGGEEPKKVGNLIPFYDNVSSIGGINESMANLDGVSKPTEYIDTGDWFRDATAAIRHYGESMVEYPTGCILALKEVYDRELIIPGLDYVIETSEYRVTKRIQKGKDPEHITAYSTNPETYADGRLVHEPFDIPWRAVIHISLVLGYVVKKNGGTMVFSNPKK